MKKNNKGIALAYTLMMMLLVFAMCAVITSIMLSQFNSTNLYSNNAETESIYLAIGEMFCASQNDVNPQVRFAQALRENDYNIISSESDEWEVEFNDSVFKLIFSTDTDNDRNNLIIQNATGKKTYLTIGVAVADGQLVEWTKGN